MKFYNSYLVLGEEFFEQVKPQKVPSPKLLLWNDALADDLFISETLQKNHELLAQYSSGNTLPKGTTPIALAYSGHQFGHFNPNLGDGRAHLLGEMIDKAGKRRDIQLKGSGQTAFSRRGDGKCALAPAVREFIMSEALYALNVPTSRCLAVASTGELINRGLAKPGAVVTRVAASHLRVGSFQYFAARGNINALQKLVDYAIERHFPEINTAELLNEESSQYDELRILQFLSSVMDKQIKLIIEWLRIGFIHGVMNTDNTAISGETIDFGPCAMMGVYDEKAVFSSIDEYGRYAFGNQGKIGHWNTARLADCLIPLLNHIYENNDSNDDNEDDGLAHVEKIIHQYSTKFDAAYYAMYANKLGIGEVNQDIQTLITELLSIMEGQKLDYTQTFYLLTQSLTDREKEQDIKLMLGDWFNAWHEQLRECNTSTVEAKALMGKNNPVVIPRNHHIEMILTRCEEALLDNKSTDVSIVSSVVDDFLHVLRSPYQELENTKDYQDTPKDNDQYYQTFCGT